MDARVQVSERQHLEMLEKRVDARHARQHGRHDDHRARVSGNTVREVEAGKALRRNRPRGQTLDTCDRDVGCRNR